MIHLKPLLKELRVTDLSKGKAAKFFIAWRDKLFVLDDNSDISTVVHWLEDHPAFDTNYGFNAEDVYELISYAADMPPDVMAGQYDPVDKSLYVQGGDKSNPVSSVMLSKIIRQLGIKKITRASPDAGDDDITYGARKNIGDVPKIGFHGTNTVNLKDILKRGISAGETEGNFTHREIYHEIDSFFAATFDDAEFYALHSTVDFTKSTYDGYKKKPEAYPVVIEFKIPDSAKVIPDYDADAHSTQPRFYDNPNPPKKVGASPMKPMGLSKEAGKFGYRGRILPGHIRSIYIHSQHQNRWRKFKPSTVARGLWSLGSEWYDRMGVGKY
jgi:hypothetical protein